MPAAQALQQAAKAGQRNRGTPIRHYLRYLVKHREHLAARVLKLSRRFAQLARIKGGEAMPGTLLEQFGLLYAGGCLAIEAGVLPWQPHEVSSALRACLLAALKQDRRPSSPQ